MTEPTTAAEYENLVKYDHMIDDAIDTPGTVWLACISPDGDEPFEIATTREHADALVAAFPLWVREF